MKAKDRVKNALARRPVDRVPVYMWLHPSTAARLARLLEAPRAALAYILGDDVRQAWVNNNYAMEGVVHDREGESHTDYWGITWRKEGEFNQIVRFPLEGTDRNGCLEYAFPYDSIETLLAQMAPAVRQAGAFFIGCDVSPCVYEMYARLRGMGAATLDLVEDPELADTMLGRCADFALALSEAACERFPLDWLWTGDDVAGQQAPIMNPALWRELIKPRLKQIIDAGKRRGLPVAYHCCGAVRPLIPDLIEIGVDVLNPVQCNCPGMDPLELKGEFGAALAFMGGVDTHDLLPNGTPDQVRAATERLIEGMTADGGGYILAASHAVPPETPDANIFAMYAAAGIPEAEIRDRAAGVRASEVRY
ncbi:MAG: hypothetical protein KA184_07795 [Candidatus Hydrogenedentes bacterium]|nr:hypothetical protein [Candidatus Hydrogenedentota bacterium]